MNAADIRCANDLALYEKLITAKDVVRVNEQIARHEAEGPTGIRRNLLSSAVRLTPSMAPEIAQMADECIEKLGVVLPLEMFVYSSPQFNAACFKPEDERLYVMFSSSLLEGFSQSELKFVMGHELGHHVYNHHAIPIGYLLRGDARPDPQLALELFAWSRYAELSADRAGAHCAQDMDSVASALFKLSSGLTSKVVEFSLDDFVSQADDMVLVDQEPGKGAPKSDWFSTHPFSPLRVKALKLFEGSELYGGKDSRESLEVGVQAILSLMEPSYLEAKTDTAESMRRLLFAGLIAVADAKDDISAEELGVFERFFGKYAFSDKLDLEKTKATLERRSKEVKTRATETQAMQVLHDLCLMAKANGGVEPEERLVLEQVAKVLTIPSAFICQTIEQASDLD
ncbi:M48 family metallopeptidase [Arenicella xantha]|uniref:Tellurite resistance protein TerB n=1 Tax=Arenicella xantha TaxID=644221 RepID=A0A395JI17_9GAMM|nr:M48 family metallopeptidase [Arenicella xantha]RBP49777.1 tellurite resistance protein TerB [Arenicella xantha]